MANIISSMGLQFSSETAAVIWISILVALILVSNFLVFRVVYSFAYSKGQQQPLPNWQERRDRLGKKIVLTRELLKRGHDHLRKANEIFENTSEEWDKLGEIVNFDKWWDISHHDDKKVDGEIEKSLKS